MAIKAVPSREARRARRWGTVVAFASAGLALGCGGTPLAPPPDGGASAPAAAGAAGGTSVVAQSLAIPAAVGPPIVTCPNGITFLIDLPCQMGMTPVSEIDCTYAGWSGALRFLLPLSLPDAVDGGRVALGQPTRFAADLLPGDGPMPGLVGVTGTVVFTKLSPAEATLDGWFPHLDFGWPAEGDPGATCTLDNGRFTAVPGNFL
jgi:hypothetical protein